MDKAQSILDWFTHAKVLAKDEYGRLIIRQDDEVMELYVKDIELIGYDEYLDDIRSLAEEYVRDWKILIGKVDSIREEENQKLVDAVIKRLAYSAPFTGKSILNPAANGEKSE